MSIALNAADAVAADQALTSAKTARTTFEGSAEMRAELLPDLGVIDLTLLLIDASIKRLCASGASSLQPAASSSTSCR